MTPDTLLRECREMLETISERADWVPGSVADLIMRLDAHLAAPTDELVKRLLAPHTAYERIGDLRKLHNEAAALISSLSASAKEGVPDLPTYVEPRDGWSGDAACVSGRDYDALYAAAKALRAYALSLSGVEAATVERCAMVCDEIVRERKERFGSDDAHYSAKQAAMQIRALSPGKQAGQGGDEIDMPYSGSIERKV